MTDIGAAPPVPDHPTDRDRRGLIERIDQDAWEGEHAAREPLVVHLGVHEAEGGDVQPVARCGGDIAGEEVQGAMSLRE
ncbi:hypothetical protein [Streptomyces sp. BE133]|uniref:hypothetical protein n=1 Tax=Streptomyces sp. BE133 TaxID=3002523 RepID=UPI002E79C079|nr:hypothetical protein [Streptomyces sp. BE133]